MNLVVLFFLLIGRTCSLIVQHPPAIAMERWNGPKTTSISKNLQKLKENFSPRTLGPLRLTQNVIGESNLLQSDPRYPPSGPRDEMRLRVLSDFHIGGSWSNNPEIRVKLMNLLKEMADPEVAAKNKREGSPITHLVINGDIWDWWLVPINQTQKAPYELFTEKDVYGYNVPQIINLIKQISKHTKVFLVRGNHDSFNSKKLTEMAFGNAVQFMEDGFEINGVWLEHGHVVDVYSTPPADENGKRKMGFSYFVTRTQGDDPKTSTPSIMKQTPPDWIINAASKNWQNWKKISNLPIFSKEENFYKWVDAKNVKKYWLEGMLNVSMPKYMNKDPNWAKSPVVGFNGKTQEVLFNSNHSDYTLEDAMADHAHDWEIATKKLGVKQFRARLLTDLEDMGNWVEYSRNHLVVVTSHTHNPELKRIERSDKRNAPSDYVVYANSGAWARDSYHRMHTSYLDITFERFTSTDMALHNRTGTKVVVGSNKTKALPSWRPAKVDYFEYPEKRPRDTQYVPKPMPGKTLGGFDDSMHPDPTEITVGEAQWLL